MNKIDELPLVSIACITYNQEKYIHQCLDGFVMQKTNFKIEVVIHDDASTDNTPSIIREYCNNYPDLFVPILQTQNKYKEGKGILVPYVYPKCRGKYIALCEGDDYWTDPYKLQKQVDFLEANPEYGMCYTKVLQYCQSGGKFLKEWGGDSTQFEELLRRNTIPTLSVVVRRDLVIMYNKDILPSNHNWKMGDYPMWLWISYNSKIYFINEMSGVYRVLNNSASHSSNNIATIDFIINRYDISIYFAEKYNKQLGWFNTQRIYWEHRKLILLNIIEQKHIQNFIELNGRFLQFKQKVIVSINILLLKMLYRINKL